MELQKNDPANINGGESWPIDHTHARATQVAEFFANMLLSIGFFSFIVAILFFTVSSQLEAVAVKKNTDRIIQEMLEPVINLIPLDKKQQIKNQMQSLVAPNMKSVDDLTSDSNRHLIKTTMLIMSTVLTFVLFTVILIWTGMYLTHKKNSKAAKPFNIKLLFVQNGVMVAFVAMVEILFLGGIGIWYRSVDANDIRMSVSQSFQTFLA
jgi:hypothetical protein